MKNQRIKVNVDSETKERLRKVAARRQCSISQVVLDLILVALDRDPAAVRVVLGPAPSCTRPERSDCLGCTDLSRCYSKQEAP